MLRFGKISEYNASKGLARVQFEDDDIVSDWIPVTMPQTKDTSFSAPLDVDEHVCCMMDSSGDFGVILGAIYSQSETPVGGNKDKYRVEFKNGDLIEYDRNTGTYQMKIGTNEFKIDKVAGYTIKKGSETLKTILSDLITAMAAETHSAPGGTTGPPTNAAQYLAIQARLNTLFQQ